MKKIFFVLCFFVLSVAVSQAQNFQWQTIGTTGISNGTPSGGTILNGKIYVNGTYYLVDGQQVNNFAVINGNTYCESGTIPGSKTFDYGYSVSTNTVYALTADSPNYMYSENQMGEWSPVSISFDNQPLFIYSINDSDFVITGGFTVVNGTSANYICIWNAVTNTVTDIGGLPGPDIYTKMCLYQDKLLVPYYIPSSSDPHFRQWNLITKTWDEDPNLIYPNLILEGFYADDSGRLYMSYIGLDANHHLALYESGSWTVIADAPVSGMVVDANGDLIVCGNFGSIGGTGVNNDMARYSNGNWYSISLGMTANSAPYQVLVCNGVLYAIGYIKHNGLKVGVMRWVDATGFTPIEPITSFGMFPNPSSEAVTIIEKPNTLMRITDLSGKVIQTFTVDNQSVIDLSSFPTGMYVVENVTQKIKEKLIVAH